MEKKGLVLGILVLLILAGLGWWYSHVEKELLRIAILSAAMVILAVGIILVIVMAGPKNKLRKLLKELESAVARESAETLKGKYVAVYNLYLKLSEKSKQNFYGRITKLRERMEGQLKAEKKVQELLEKSSVTNITLLRKQYEEMYGYFRKLPVAVQQKYYPQIMHVKEKLEKGNVLS